MNHVTFVIGKIKLFLQKKKSMAKFACTQNKQINLAGNKSKLNYISMTDTRMVLMMRTKVV